MSGVEWRVVAVSEDTLVDFALIAFREDGQWQVSELPPALPRLSTPWWRRCASSRARASTLALCSYGDDFFLATAPERRRRTPDALGRDRRR